MNLAPESFLLMLHDFDDAEDDHYGEFVGMRFRGVSKNYERVHNHCHYTNKYRRAAYSICNLRYKHKKKFLWSSTVSQTMTTIL